MPNSTPPTLVDIKEAALMADRSTRTIRNWIKEGKLKASKKDPNNTKSKLLINKEELQILLATEIDMNPARKPIEKTSETLQKEVKELQIALEMEKLKNTQKDEIIEILKNMQPDVATIKDEYETKLKEVQEKLQIAEQEVVVLKHRYQLEIDKGWLERFLYPPTKIPLLPPTKE